MEPEEVDSIGIATRNLKLVEESYDPAWEIFGLWQYEWTERGWRLKVFTLFPYLPTETRLQIWGHAAGPHPSHLSLRCRYGSRRNPPMVFSCEEDFDDLTSLLVVNQDSRSVVQELFPVRVPSNFLEAIRFNPAETAIHLTDWNMLIKQMISSPLDTPLRSSSAKFASSCSTWITIMPFTGVPPYQTRSKKVTSIKLFHAITCVSKALSNALRWP